MVQPIHYYAHAPALDATGGFNCRAGDGTTGPMLELNPETQEEWDRMVKEIQHAGGVILNKYGRFIQIRDDEGLRHRCTGKNICAIRLTPDNHHTVAWASTT